MKTRVTHAPQPSADLDALILDMAREAVRRLALGLDLDEQIVRHGVAGKAPIYQRRQTRMEHVQDGANRLQEAIAMLPATTPAVAAVQLRLLYAEIDLLFDFNDPHVRKVAAMVNSMLYSIDGVLRAAAGADFDPDEYAAADIMPAADNPHAEP